MTRIAPLAFLMLLAACADLYKFDNAPAAAFPKECESQVYADPTVRDLIAKSAGAENNFGRENVDTLRYAKLDAARRCEVQKGITPPGGGVERPRIR